MSVVLTPETVVQRVLWGAQRNWSRFQNVGSEFHEIAEVVTIGKARAIGAICMPENRAANSAQLVRPSCQLAITTASDSP